MGTGRNSEKRRERSKVAARDRRSKESEIFSELSQYLPLPESTRNSLDKASVMRLSLSDLKLRSMVEKVFSTCESTIKKVENNDETLESDLGTLLNNAMGGFVVVLSTEGDIIYMSESVTTHLGLAQTEVMGLNIYDFSHPCDHADIKELLANKKGVEEYTGKRSGSFRMKCTITERGRNVHIRAATYKLIDFTGRLRPSIGEDETAQWFIGVGEPLLHPSDVDIPLNKQTFLTKHTPDMKCEFVDDSIGTFLGYCPEDLVGKSIFEFHHASDGPALTKAFKSLYLKGQTVTERYRFLAKHGGWIWVVTQATLIQSNNGMKPNSIVCLNFVTSGIENEDEIVSTIQLECLERPVSRPFTVITPNKLFSPVHTMKEEIFERRQKENILPHIIPASKPIPSTAKIFAPRTEDMDSGFLMPCDDRLIASKEEPEDLTHLAPIAGDESVPLALPLLDNLLRSLDEANMDYTISNFVIDVNADELPLLEDERECGESSLKNLTTSPLFLQSDPHMVSSPGSKSSLLSPFQQQLSPSPSTSQSNSYTCSSPLSPDTLDNSPYSLGRESTSNFDSSNSSVPALVSMSLQDLGRHWANNPGCPTSTIDYRSHSPLEINFMAEEEVSNCSQPLPRMTNLPVNDKGEYVVGGQFNPVVNLANESLLVLPDFNVSNNRILNRVLVGGTILNQFPCSNNGTSTINSKNGDSHSGCCSNSITLPTTGRVNELVRTYDKVWHSTVTQKRPHQMLNIKSEVSDKGCDIVCTSGPHLPKQPKLTSATFEGGTRPSTTNHSSAATVVTYPIDQVPGDKKCTSKETKIGVSVPAVVSSSNEYTISQRTSAASTSLDPPPQPPPSDSEKCVSEIDLKAYVQNLLSSGRSDIINALFKELSNYRKECNLGQATTDDDNTPTVIPIKKTEMSEALKSSSPPPPDTSQCPTNKMRNNQEGNPLITVVDLCSDTTKALVELTTLDCEVNAPANEGSSHLHASDLVKDLDEDNFLV